jgi:hypothetical protein
MPFQPTDELSIRMTVAEWNQIMAQLQKSPYEVAAPLIGKITSQANAAQAQQAQSYQDGEAHQNRPPNQEPATPIRTRTKPTVHGGDLSA